MREPSVIVDVTAIPSDYRGVGRYAEELTRALDMAGTYLSIVCRSRDSEHFSALAPHARIVDVAERRKGDRIYRLMWEQVGLPSLIRKVGAEVIHSIHYTLPLLSPVPTVVTLHDALSLSDPRLFSLEKRVFLPTWTRISLKRATECLVISEATARELRRHTHTKRRLTIAHLGIASDRFHQPSQEEVQTAALHLGLNGRPYIAFLGTLEPRKNLPQLIQGFGEAVKSRSDPPVLVLAGGAGWGLDLHKELADLPPNVTVLLPGYLPVDILAGYLGGATIVVYPSLGEGFGLPVLEAMACGAAVLTTRRLALPEVGGDAVAYTGTDAGAIAESLGFLLNDPAKRAELSGRALARAALSEFSWAEHARSCKLLYQQAIASRA